MNNNKNFIKDTLNKELSHIKVTQELKNKTLEKCKKSNIKKVTFNTKIATAASLAFLSVASLTYYNFIHKTSNEQLAKNIIEKQPINNDDSIKKDSIKEDSSEIQKTIDNTTNNKNNSKNNTTIDSSTNSNTENKNSNLNPSSEEKNSPSVRENTSEKTLTKETKQENAESHIEHPDKALAINPFSASEITVQATLDDAEKHLNQKITLPSYVPEGYHLESLKKEDNSSKSVVLTYKKENDYFKISIKNLEKMNSLSPRNVKSSKLTFDKNNLNYSITGNVNTDTLENILKSIKE